MCRRIAAETNHRSALPCSFVFSEQFVFGFVFLDPAVFSREFGSFLSLFCACFPLSWHFRRDIFPARFPQVWDLPPALGRSVVFCTNDQALRRLFFRGTSAFGRQNRLRISVFSSLSLGFANGLDVLITRRSCGSNPIPATIGKTRNHLLIPSLFGVCQTLSAHSVSLNPTKTKSSPTNSGRLTSMPSVASRAIISSSVISGSLFFRSSDL